jgi:Zn-dependent protease with chaperone function
MIVAVVLPLLAAAAMIFFAPLLLSRGNWRIAHPRLAVRAWMIAFVSGGIGLLASLLAALTGILTSLSVKPAGWLGPVALTLFGWVGLAAVGALIALAISRFEPMSAAERRTNVQIVLAAAAATYRRERLRGVDVSFVESAQPSALATRGTGRQILVSRGLEELLAPAELRSVLEHERAHLTDGHDRVVRLARLNLACFPTLLGARTFERNVNLLVELAADDLAARRCGSTACADALDAMARATGNESLSLRAGRLRHGIAPSAPRRRAGSITAEVAGG